MGRTRYTYCRICEAACGLEVVYDGDRPVRLVPDRGHPTTRGFACAKGTRFLEVARHPERLRAPQRRTASGWRSASWSTALSEIGGRLRELQRRHGPDAIAVYFGNPLAFHAAGAFAMANFVAALGTRNLYTAGSQDCNNKFVGAEIVYGSPLIHPIPDLERAAFALWLGSNPAVSQGSFLHLAGGSRHLDELVEGGLRTLWIDPRRTESARRWGEHWAIRPGADVFLLLALLDALAETVPERAPGFAELRKLAARWPAERVAELVDLPADAIRDLAQRLLREPSCLHMSVGINQGPFGTLAYVLLQALAWASGNLGTPGGLLFHPLAGLLRRIPGLGLLRSGIDGDGTPVVLGSRPGSQLAPRIEQGQIHALVVVAGDPVRSIAGGTRLRAALERLDLLVSIDLFPNTTNEVAHWLLPTKSWLERWDVATTASLFATDGLVPIADPVLAPEPTLRGEAEILAGLALAASLAWPGGRRWTRLWATGRGERWLRRSMRPFLTRRDGRPMLRLPRPRPRPPGRLRFWDRRLAAEAGRLAAWADELADPERLWLIGRRLRLGHNSWLGRAGRDHAPPRLWAAPETWERFGIAPGVPVELDLGTGVVAGRAEAEPGMHPQAVAAAHGVPAGDPNAPVRAIPDEPVAGMQRLSAVPVQGIRAAAVADRAGLV